MSYNQIFERTLAVIGSPSVGKSALSQVFVKKTFPTEYYPTIEKIYQLEDFKAKNRNYKLKIYDTAGLESYSFHLPVKYIDSHGFILVYSVADLKSFETVKYIYNMLKNVLYTQKMHIVLIGNKIDLKEERCVSYEDGLNLANEWKMAGTIVSFIEVSALTGEVTEIFLTMLNMIDSNEIFDINNNINNNNNNDDKKIGGDNQKPNACTIS